MPNKKFFALLLIFLSSLGRADLTQLNDTELDEVVGKGIIEIVELIDPTPLDGSIGGVNSGATNCPGGVPNGSCGLRFMRIRTGAEVQLNANIGRLQLGNYVRNDPYVVGYCSDGVPTCKEGDANYVNNPLPWVADAGDRFSDERLNLPTSDVIVENASFGAVIGGAIQPLKMINPFLEFVFDESNGELVGFRTGAENQIGHFGNQSNAAACPLENTGKDCNGGALSFSGTLYVDLKPDALGEYTGIFSAARGNTTPTIGGIGAILAPTPAQRLGDFNHRNTQEFYISVNTVPIRYPTISGDPNRQGLYGDKNRYVNGIGPFAPPGFALSITDGVSVNAAIAGLGAGVPKFSNCFNGSLGGC